MTIEKTAPAVNANFTRNCSNPLFISRATKTGLPEDLGPEDLNPFSFVSFQLTTTGEPQKAMIVHNDRVHRNLHILDLFGSTSIIDYGDVLDVYKYVNANDLGEYTTVFTASAEKAFLAGTPQGLHKYLSDVADPHFISITFDDEGVESDIYHLVPVSPNSGSPVLIGPEVARLYMGLDNMLRTKILLRGNESYGAVLITNPSVGEVVDWEHETLIDFIFQSPTNRYVRLDYNGHEADVVYEFNGTVRAWPIDREVAESLKQGLSANKLFHFNVMPEQEAPINIIASYKNPLLRRAVNIQPITIPGMDAVHVSPKDKRIRSARSSAAKKLPRAWSKKDGVK